MHIDTPEVRALVRQAFPDYNGRRYEVQPFRGPMRLDSYWSGGSRDYFTAVRLTDGATSAVPENGTPWNPPVGELAELPENTALVAWHRGGHSYVTVYVRPENLNRFALPPAVELTREERIVLVATLAQWDTAKASCQVKGLLNKAGAITDAGRNVAGDYSVRLDNLKPELAAI